MDAFRVVVVGAGAAGMMAAGQAASLGADVTLLEKNHRSGRKILITGKGRCNITNNCDINTLIANTVSNPRFLYSAFSQFSPQDTIDFFEQRGVALKTERGNRVFPVSDKSVDINDALFSFCKQSGVHFVPDTSVTALVLDGENVTGVKVGGTVYPCELCIVATGGRSYPATGSTGDGYTLARQVGHTVTPIAPSLVPLVCAEDDCRQMQGLALKNIAITVRETGGKVVYEDFGELLFTHFGLSGPVILSASSHIRKGIGHTVSIDLKPALDEEKLDARIQRDFSQNLNKCFANSLGALLPRSMEPVIVQRSGIDPELKVNSVTREQRRQLVHLIKHFELTVTGFRPVDEAIITSGGVAVGEIDPRTMRSKLVGGLAFAGEVIDVDAHTGGFNLQIALSTGFVAGSQCFC